MLDILGYVFLAWMALLPAAGLVIMTKVTWEIVIVERDGDGGEKQRGRSIFYRPVWKQKGSKPKEHQPVRNP